MKYRDRTKFSSFVLLLLASALLGPVFANGNTRLAVVHGKAQADWATVQGLAKGAKVRVETKDRKTYLGKVDGVTDATLMITTDSGQPQSVARDSVKRVFRFEKGDGSRGKSIGIWAAIGAGVGAGIGAAVLGATGGSDETGKVIAPFILGGAGAGAAIGAAIGKGEKKVVVYEAK